MNIWKTIGLAFTGLAVTTDSKHLREESHSTSVVPESFSNATGNSLSAIMSGLSSNNTVAEIETDYPLYRTMKNAGYSDVNYHYTGKEIYGADCSPSACYSDLNHNAEQKFAITTEGGFGVFYYQSLSDCAGYSCSTDLGSFSVTVDYNGLHINSEMDTLVYGCDSKDKYCVQAPDKTDPPTSAPTSKPSKKPSSMPTPFPTVSFKPTTSPTVAPTTKPTGVPTVNPTVNPTISFNPTTQPTGTPTAAPTEEKKPTTPSWTTADTIGATVGSVVGLAAIVAGIFYREPIVEVVNHCYEGNDSPSLFEDLLGHVGKRTGSFGSSQL